MTRRRQSRRNQPTGCGRCSILVLAVSTVLMTSPIRAEEPAWCAPELDALKGNVCSQTLSEDKADLLVIFLHGVIKPDTTWQHQQQRAIARGAAANGYDVIMPRGRRGIGPLGMRDWWTWPTSAKAQRQLGTQLFDEWRAAQQQLEARRGRAYSKVFLFGFSNGAYYASQLVLQGTAPAMGVGVFAGGASGEWLARSAKTTQQRVPLYVEVGSSDKTATKDGHALKRLLERLNWPHRFVERAGVGHSMTDRGVKAAISFLNEHSQRP